MACDGTNINPVALAILNTKLPNGQFAIPSPQVALPPSSGTDPADQVPLGLSTFLLLRVIGKISLRSISIMFCVRGIPFRQGSFIREGGFSCRLRRMERIFRDGPTDALNRNTIFVLADTHVFSSNLVNIARFAYSRFDGLVRQASPISAQDVGMGTPTGATGSDLNMPALTVGGFQIGTGGYSYRLVGDELIHLAGDACVDEGSS